MNIKEEATRIRSIAVNFERDEAINEIIITLENLVETLRGIEDTESK